MRKTEWIENTSEEVLWSYKLHGCQCRQEDTICSSANPVEITSVELRSGKRLCFVYIDLKISMSLDIFLQYLFSSYLWNGMRDNTEEKNQNTHLS